MSVLGWIILTLWVVALATTLLNLATVPRLRSRSPRRFARVSAIIPARDEERAIERTVRALLAQTYRELEIIVVNDRSVDRTEEILRGIEGVIVIHGEEPPAGWLGKPWALHQGSRRATGELLLFLDADVIYEAPDAIESAVAHLEESGMPLVALFPHLRMCGFWENVIMPNLAMFGFTVLPLWMSNRSLSPILAVGGGPGNLVRRADYDAVGGHEALHNAVVDDVGLARLFRRHGRRTEIIRASHAISVRMYHGLGEIIRGFTKNAFAVFDYNYVVAAGFLLLAIAGHLLPFVLACMGNPFGIATVALIVVTRVVLFASLRYRIDNAILGHPLMMAAWCWILLRSMWFTGIRRQLHWRGRTYDAGRTRF
jgi:chlorobactene glucosyltransferase